MNNSILSEDHLAYRETLSTNNITNINIESIVGTLDVTTYDEPNLKAELYFSNTSYSPYFSFDVTTNNNEINISFKKKSLLAFIFSKIYLKVLIPKNYNSEININSTSGDLILDTLNIANLNIQQISGNIDLNNISSEKIYIKSSSGDISLEETFSKNIQIHSISGKISCNLNNSETRNFKDSLLDIQATSGSININLIGFFQDIKLTNISGSIDLKLNTKYHYDCNTKTISGKATVETSTSTNKEFCSTISASATSGNIFIRNH